MYQDRRGVPCSAAGPEAVRAFDDVVDEYLSFGRNTGTLLKQTAALDPDMPMQHVMRGYLFHLMGNAALNGRARQCLLRAEAGVTGLSGREKLHVAALAAWCDGDLGRAVDLLEAVLIEHPRDVLALKLAHFLHFYLGDIRNHCESVNRVMHAWDEGVPGYGFVLGCRAFGLEEAGEYEEAERTGRRAIEINPGDLWAGHAVAHVMEMQGRHREGIAWVTQHETVWEKGNSFSGHIWWHRGLFHLALEQHDAVLAEYDRRIRAEPSDDYLDISNATSLLLRLDMAGVDVGDRWAELAEVVRARIHDHVFPFIDVHFMMALAKAGDNDAADELLLSMRSFADANRATTMSPVMQAVGIPVANAVQAYGAGDHGRVVDLLLPIRDGIIRIGGSHAQRDVFSRMLIESALRAGRAPVAEALLRERRTHRPLCADAWKAYARALDQLGDTAGAGAAREASARLLAA